ncbi:hypothetical protein C4J81_17450 [Deltaproteobacteria bacterium Smac51]|nr:hypothetical protein C4J81_17450 [Deltaproteobacteria bacterium Smac51]
MSRRKLKNILGPGKSNPRNAVFVLLAIAALYLLQESGFWPAAGPGPQTDGLISGRVVKVHDGDTFTMIDSGDQKIKVRLFGIDAPELDQAHGRESRRYLRELLEGHEVRVESRGFDQYDRLLGLIYRPDGHSITQDLVESGQVWVYENYCDIDYCAQLRQAQKEAKSARRGLWGDENPLAPWKYRRAQN